MSLMLSIACGSQDGFVLLRDGEQEAFCDSLVEDTFREGVLVSEDQHARLQATGLDIPIEASIQVDCNRPLGQVGNAYVLGVSQSFPTVTFTIGYSHLDLQGVNLADLRIGTYDSQNRLWIPEGNARPDFVTQTISISGPLPNRYAIYREAPTPSGDVLPPTTPEIRFVVVRGDSIEVGWTPSEDPGGGPIFSYLIARTPPGSQIDTVLGTVFEYVDNGQTAPFDDTMIQEYCYRITAVDDDNTRSEPSPEVCSAPFPPG